MICRVCKTTFPDHPGYKTDACPGCRLAEAILAETQEDFDVLDVGCGPGSNYSLPMMQKLGCLKLGGGEGSYTVMDAHFPYFIKARWPPTVRQVVGEAPGTLAMFARGAFDVALGIDFPEHFLPRDLPLLHAAMKRIATKVLWFVPLGKHPQSSDFYRTGADKWQTHRSIWTMVTAEDGSGGEFLTEAYGEEGTGVAFTPDRAVIFSDFHAWEHPDAPGAALLIWE
jgi:SAM-dependent methyltransferase